METTINKTEQIVDTIKRWQIFLLISGSLLLANPEIELINLIAAIILFCALIPYGISIIKGGVK